MNYKKIIYMCLVALIVVFILYRFIGDVPRNNSTIIQPQQKGTLPMQTNSEGSVDITVTPKVLAKGKTVQFDITFTTHMGSLDFDLLKVSKLVDDSGTTYKPTSWTGGSGGHHLAGILTFPSLSNRVSKVALTLSSIENADRVFSWDLK